MAVPVEPGSFTIGVIALASFFNTCVQCFDVIELARTYTQDYEKIIIKLSTMKRRLMVSGDLIAVLSSDEGRDNVLDNPDDFHPIHKSSRALRHCSRTQKR